MVGAVSAQDHVPVATLTEVPPLRLPGAVDSNSPAMWELVQGQPRLYVFTSNAGKPSRAIGQGMASLARPTSVTITPHPGDGVWMEGIVRDSGGTWYGFYHHEVPAIQCGRPDVVRPSIGMVRSTDRGRNWTDLGTILEAPTGSDRCESQNRYFVGGVGDVGVVLDQTHTFVYLFFSQYGQAADQQGIGVARMLWADRDQPQGKLDVWVSGTWLPMDRGDIDADGQAEWAYFSGTPLVTPQHPWHDDDPEDDGFWGASIHWNSSIDQYVMLLNRVADDAFTQEGIYISFNPDLSNPDGWSAPTLLLKGGNWYPQVLGFDAGSGTDKEADDQARFFMGGESRYIISFSLK